MSHESRLLEDAVLAALGPLKKELGGPFRTLESLVGPFDQNAASAALRFPFAYVSVGEVNFTSRNLVDVIEVGLNVHVGERNFKGASPAATVVQGLLMDVREQLIGLHPAPGWTALRLHGESAFSLWPDASCLVCRAEYHTRGIVSRRA